MKQYTSDNRPQERFQYVRELENKNDSNLITINFTLYATQVIIYNFVLIGCACSVIVRIVNGIYLPNPSLKQKTEFTTDYLDLNINLLFKFKYL